jgi:hypothetical protein
LGDRTDKYLTEWSKKRDAWLLSGRKDDSYLLRGSDLSAFREFVIGEPRRVTSDDRGFLLACDRRADTSALMRSQDIDAILIEDTDVSVVSEPQAATPVATPSAAEPSAAQPSASKQRGPGKWQAIVLLAINIVLLLSMLGLGWVVKGLLLQLHEAKREGEKTQAMLSKKTEELERVHADLTQQSKAKEALEKELPEVQTRRDDVSKVLDALTQNRRSAEEQLKAVESVLAVAQEEISKQGKGLPKGRLKVEFDRLLVKRLLLMLPLRCPKDLAECTDEAIEQSVRRLAPKSSLRELVSPLPHVIVYPRSAAKNAKMLPLREGQLRKLLNLPGDKSDLLVIFCPRLPEEKGTRSEARYQALLGFLQKSLKLAPERLLRINYAGLLAGGALKGLAPAECPKKGEANPAESIWVVRAPGPRPIG